MRKCLQKIFAYSLSYYFFWLFWSLSICLFILRRWTFPWALTLWKSVCVRSYSGPYFFAFGLNTERYSLSLRIQSECEKMRTRITPNTSTFYAVLHISLIYQITICCSIVIYFAVVWFTCFLCVFQEEIFLKQLAIHCPEYENIMSTKCNY